MKLDAIAAAAAAALAVASLVGAVALTVLYVPGAYPHYLFLDGTLDERVSMAASWAIIAVTVILALVARSRPAGAEPLPRLLFRLLAAIGALAGLWGGVLGYAASMAASAQVGGVSLEVRAPGHIAQLYCVSYGMLAASAA